MGEELSIEDVFKFFDKDGSGSIDKAELTKGLQALGSNPTEADIKALMEDADSKATPNGRIEFTEFAEIVETHRKSKEEEKEALLQAFGIFDKNGDGTINKEELRQALTTLGFGKLSNDEVEELFSEADADENGYIDFNELVRVMVA